MKTIVLETTKKMELKELFLDVFSGDPWFDKWDDDRKLDLYLKDLTDNSNSLSLVLIDDEGQLIGGALGYVFNWWEGREYFIKEFFISRKHQNQGIGSLFLDQMNDTLNEQRIRHITLATEKTFPAYYFYQKNGFYELSDSVFMAKKVRE